MVMDEKELILGLGLLSFYGVAKFWGERQRASKALCRISAAPCGRVSDLRSLLLLDTSSDDDSADGRLVVLRGWAVCSPVLVVERADPSAAHLTGVFPSAVPTGPLESFFNALLLESLSRNARPSSSSSDQSLQRNRDILKDKGYRFSMELVPYALVDGDQRVYVAEDKTRPVPLKMVNHHMDHLQSPSYPFISSLEDYKHLVAMWNREKHVTVEKEITAIGICRNRDGPLQIESCRLLPYFVTDLTKDEIETRLAETADNYLCATIMVGALTVSIFGFGFLRFGGDMS